MGKPAPLTSPGLVCEVDAAVELLKRRATPGSSRGRQLILTDGDDRGAERQMWRTALRVDRSQTGTVAEPLSRISSLSVGLRITRLNGSSMAKKKVSSSIAGISLCSTMVARVGSIPAASQSVAMAMTSRRMSAGASLRVVKACLLAMRK